jgi:hypothetical protein
MVLRFKSCCQTQPDAETHVVGRRELPVEVGESEVRVSVERQHEYRGMLFHEFAAVSGLRADIFKKTVLRQRMKALE